MRMPVETHKASEPQVPTSARMVINGELRLAEDGRVLRNLSPIDGTHLCDLPDAGAADVDRAVAAARAAFEDRRWVGLAPKERKKRLLAWAELVEGAQDELA